MRALTKKQKSLIKKWFLESGRKYAYESKATYNLKNADDLTPEQWDILEEINDTEILYQNVNRYILDLHTEKLTETGWYN